MKIKLTFCILAFAIASIIALPSARADEYNQSTILTFNQPVQVPGSVLPAGTYWFVLVESTSSRNIVQVFNSDNSTLCATFLSTPTERVTATDETAIAFAEGEPMQSQIIVSWFYPGETIGHQFVYSKMQERELAQVKQYTVVAKTPQKRQNGVAGY